MCKLVESALFVSYECIIYPYTQEVLSKALLNLKHNQFITLKPCRSIYYLNSSIVFV